MAALVKVPRTGAPRYQAAVVDPGVARQIVAAFDESRLGPLVRFAVATGLRQGELLALRWEDLDLDRGTVTVRHSTDRSPGAVRLARPKTDKSRRTLALNDMARAALADRKRQAAEDELAAGDRWEGGEIVFAGPTGGLQNGDALTHNFQEHLVRRGLPRLRWHDLRRVFAAVLLDGGVPITHVRDLLGHSDLRVTQSYAYTMPDSLTQAMGAVDEAFGARATSGPQTPNEGTTRVSRVGDLADSA